MCKAILVSEAIINECIDKKYPLNTSKLQKILYFMQKECLERYNVPVFDEDIIAWECGPAIKEVNDYFVLGRLGFENKVNQSIILRDLHQKCLDSVLDKYGYMSPTVTAEESKKDQAWKIIWRDGKGKGDIIPLTVIVPPSERNFNAAEEM